MGNEPAGQNANSQSMSTEWSGSIWFGNGVRKVDFFYKPFDIPGAIVAVEEIVQNGIVLVVNKVKWYGLRLILCDLRRCGYEQPRQGDYETLKLTNVWGIYKEDVDTHIKNIKYYFQSHQYADAPWEILKKEYEIERKYPPRRQMELKIDTDGASSRFQRIKAMEPLVAGDILIITRAAGYDHYAIYVGNGDVINIDSKKNGGGAVKESFHEVCGGGKSITESVKVEYKLIEMTPRSLIVQVALALLDEKNPLYKGAYNLLTKNCEHFARGCSEAGKDKILSDNFKPHGRCTQVKKVTQAVVGAVAVGAVGGAIVSGGPVTLAAGTVTKAALMGAVVQATLK